MEKNIIITGPAGVLEALLRLPLQDGEKAVAIICHPHPLFLGSMHNKIITTLAKVADVCGLPSLRFNFRGVGQSAGQFDGGRGELADVLAVIQEARQLFKGRDLWLFGFSFGGAMAIEAATRVPVEKLIVIAPSVRCFLSNPKPMCPILIVQGEADEIVDPQSVYDFAATLPSMPRVIRLPGVGHFFHGALTLLKETLIEALA